MSERHKVPIAADFIPIREGKVFLMRRTNTDWQSGNYGLPGGHVEEGEHPAEAAAREAYEEAGIRVDPAALKCMHASHRSQGEYGEEYVDFFFIAEHWEGEPENMEPDRCDDAAWFPLGDLPPNTIGFIRDVLRHIQNGVFYSEQ